jgi:hypothetical protein
MNEREEEKIWRKWVVVKPYAKDSLKTGQSGGKWTVLSK